jgi:acetyltransferase
MSVRNLDRLFRPTSLALIGASDTPGTPGSVALGNLLGAGFQGPVFQVSRRHPPPVGPPVYPDVESLPQPADLAVIAAPPATLPDLVRTLGAHGTKAAVILGAGFAEFGEPGRQAQRDTLAAARPHLLRLVGPGNVGVMVPGVGLNASVAHLNPMRGDIAFVSQSAALISAVLDWAKPRRIGFSHVVSLGEMADVDLGDMLDYLAADPATRAILLYIESVTHARKFMSAARAAARSKPVVVVKAGRFAVRARGAGSQTKAQAGSDDVYEAAFRRAGMLRVGTMRELFDAAETLTRTHPQRGDRLAILTNGTGPGKLAAEAILCAGGELAALSAATIAALNAMLPASWSHGNPIDRIGDASPPSLAEALALVLRDPGVDAALVLNSPTAFQNPTAAADAVIGALAPMSALAATGRNVFTAWLGEHSVVEARQLFAKARIATYQTPDDAVAGFMHRVRHRRSQDLLMEVPPLQQDGVRPDAAAAEAAIDRALAAGRHWLDADEVEAVLGAYGIPAAKSCCVADADAAAEAAAAIGGPVALKIRSPDIGHKSNLGGVALHLEGASHVQAAALAMLQRVRRMRPEARIDGFLVQPMIVRPAAFELIVGLADDSTFGPVVLFGHGGTAVALLDDASLELPPLNMTLARSQMARTRVWRLLQGHGAQAPADIDAIAGVLIRVGQIACAHAAIAELEINPLIADAEGVVALDAHIGVAACPRTARERLAILPYPVELEAAARLSDGARIRVRPIRPEDEPILRDMITHLSAEDIRMRFFVSMQEMPHALAARLSQIDYDREMALVALPADRNLLLGVARFAADPDNREAEFAVTVRTDCKRQGLGRVLMDRLLAVARRRGIGAIYGDVASENGPMLAFCRTLGFTAGAHPNDPHLLRVTYRFSEEVETSRVE